MRQTFVNVTDHCRLLFLGLPKNLTDISRARLPRPFFRLQYLQHGGHRETQYATKGHAIRQYATGTRHSGTSPQNGKALQRKPRILSID